MFYPFSFFFPLSFCYYALQVLWLVWFSMPCLSLSFLATPVSYHDLMTHVPQKNRDPDPMTMKRFLWFLVLRVAPTCIVVVVLFLFSIVAGLKVHASSIPDIPNKFSDWEWITVGWIGGTKHPWNWTKDDELSCIAAQSQNLAMTVWVWFGIFMSASFMYRNESLRKSRPWRFSIKFPFLFHFGFPFAFVKMPNADANVISVSDLLLQSNASNLPN